jgi:hypothetical protein
MKVAPTSPAMAGKRGNKKNTVRQLPLLNLSREAQLPSNPATAYTVMDIGADQAHLGKGWTIVKVHKDLPVKDRLGRPGFLVDAVATVINLASGNKREFIVRVNQAVYNRDDQESLLPPDQLRWAGYTVDVCSIKFGGTQTIDGRHFKIPLWWDGKTYWFKHVMTKQCDKGKPIHVLTSPLTYKPRDYLMNNVQEPIQKPEIPTEFNDIEIALPGSDDEVEEDYKFCPATDPAGDEPLGEYFMPKIRRRRYLWDAEGHHWKPNQLAEWSKRLGEASVETVKKTFLATTQLVPSVRHENETIIKDYHVPRFPMLTPRRLREPVFCDIVEFPKDHNETKKTSGLLFYGGKSKILMLYPFGSNKTISAAKGLEYVYEFIRDFGCPDILYSDFANNLTKAASWIRLGRLTQIKIKSSEAYKHEQNTVERAWGSLQAKGIFSKGKYNIPRDRRYDMYKHLCDVHNHTALGSLKDRTPMEALTGDTPDISVFRYYFWEPVWFMQIPGARQKEQRWVKGRFLGVAWSVGDNMCYEVAPDPGEDTSMQRVVCRSLVVPRATEENHPRQILKHPSDHFFPTPYKAQQEEHTPVGQEIEPPVEPSNNKKRKNKSGGSSKRHKISESDIEQIGNDEPLDPSSVDAGTTATVPSVTPIEDEIRADYLRQAQELEEAANELSVPLESLLDDQNVEHIKSYKYNPRKDAPYTFSVQMVGHVKPLTVSLDDLKQDAPVTLSKFIMASATLRSKNEHKELTLFAKKTIKSHDKVLRLTNDMERKFGRDRNVPREPQQVTVRRTISQTPVRTKRGAPKPKPKVRKKNNPMGTIKYGVYIPKNVQEALAIDGREKSNLWKEAICKEIGTLMSMGTFKILTKQDKNTYIKQSQYAPLRMIFDVKQDLRRKARLVIGGHVVDATGYDVYASNMKTVSARLLMLIASANKMDVLTGDIGSAYLFADSDMSVRVKLGPEFHVFDKTIPLNALAKVEKALYGLPTSANRWHAHLADSLRALGFTPTRYDADIWIRPNPKDKNLYDYVGSHTDDLMVVSSEPQAIMTALQKVYTIKKIQEPHFHLGCDYRQNSDGSWSIGTKTYVAEALKKAAIILGKEDLGKETTPMAEVYKPELETSPMLTDEGHRKYQQLIGILQWMVTCGRLDLQQAVSSLSRFSAAPRAGHLVAATRIFKYLNRHPDEWVKIDPSPHVPPAALDVPNGLDSADWKQHYQDAKEELDPKSPPPRGAFMDTVIYFDSNWAHDEITRRSISGVVSFIGNTPVSWLSKRQGAIATSTYSAELCAAKVGAEEAVALRYMMRSLGINLRGKTILAGDNLGALTSATQPGSPCKKKHVNIAYHYVRECNAAGIIDIRKIHTDFNPSDPFTKALGKNKFWIHFRFLFKSS